jgi:hypothetical protein
VSRGRCRDSRLCFLSILTWRPPCPPSPVLMLMVYGLPPSKQDRLQSFLSMYGTLTHFQVGPSDSNHVVVAFEDPTVGLRLERRSGELRLDGCYLGVRRVSEGAVADVWTRSDGQHRVEVAGGEGNHGAFDQHDASHAMDVRPAPAVVDPNDPFASISTLTPIKSGSVFRPMAAAASASSAQQQQKAVDPKFAFGTGQQPHPQQQQTTMGQQSQASIGFLGRMSDVMVSTEVRFASSAAGR